MKKKFSTIAFTLLIATLFVSCSSSSDGELDETNASLSIRVGGVSSSTSRLVGDAFDNSELEDVLSNLTVFVFNYSSGVLEKMEVFPLDGTGNTKTITGLTTATTKRIVAFVNVPSTVDLSSITSYTQLNANLITLDSQNSATDLATTGLFMSGEYGAAVTLTAAETTTVSIGVARRVAKVYLNELAISPTDGLDINLFSLTGVSVQIARLTGTAIGGLVQPSDNATSIYASGIASSADASPNFSIVRDYLREDITLDVNSYVTGTNVLEDNAEPYFYLLPNNNADNYPTLMTIYGTYSDEPVYYTFAINAADAENTIASNVKYRIRVALSKLNLGTTDPNVIPEEAALNVSIVPLDWEDPVEQSVEW